MFSRPSPQVAFASFVVGGSLAVLSVNAAVQPAPFAAQSWTTENNLPQNRVTCLKQTRDGYLWIGGWGGLGRFDGVRCVAFTRSNTPELNPDAIGGLEEDAEGTLWIATKRGFVTYRDHHFRRVALSGAPEEPVWRPVRRSKGGIWFHTDGRLWIFDGRQFLPGRKIESSPFPEICSMHEDSLGNLNVFTDRAWLMVSADGQNVVTNVSVTNQVRWLAGDAIDQNKAWVGTTAGLLEIVANRTNSVAIDDVRTQEVTFVQVDRTGNTWLQAQNGNLYCFDQKQWLRVDLGERFSSADALCMEEAEDKSVWIGTDQGLVRLEPQPIRTYTTRDGLSHNDVLTVCEGKDGTIWVGTRHGVSSIKNGIVKSWAAEEPCANRADLSVWPAAHGGVWINNVEAGVVELRGDSFLMPIPHSYARGTLNALCEDDSGCLWVGSTAALFRWSDGIVRTNVAGEHVLRDVRCIFQSRDRSMWFGTKGHGLAHVHEGQIDFVTTQQGLGDNTIWAIHENPPGVLWLATPSGLNRYENGRAFAFSRNHGFLEETVNCVLEDNSGFLWLSGLRGIYRVRRAALDAIAKGEQPWVRVSAFGTADGMERAETNGGENQPAGWKARDGRLWFPTIRGVVRIDPKKLPAPTSPPRVVIEQVKAGDKIIYGDGEPEPANGERKAPDEGKGRARSIERLLAPGSGRGLEFCYTANTFSDSQRTIFRHRVKGIDPGWITSGERVARYLQVSPGTYEFEVTAGDVHNVWSLEPKSFQFSIAPFFWQTWWFYTGCVVGAVGLAAALQGYRLRWQRRLLKLEEQRALANERSRIARDLHDDLGTALTGLALELDVAGRDPRAHDSVGDRLTRSASRARELAERMREVVWSVNPRCDNIASLADFLEQQVAQFLRISGIKVRIDFPEDIPPMPLRAEARHELALSVREALTNVVRHASASEILLRLGVERGKLVVQVKDNGRGLDEFGRNGNGLTNMRARMEQIGGDFSCESSPGAGTLITFHVPLGNGDSAHLS
jgi:signal transduction histidine kinase/ligand-binding sensor domain-containing protein